LYVNEIAGYYPNKLINSDFQSFESDNETLSSWETLGNASIYRIVSDTQNGSMVTAIELTYDSEYLSSPIAVSQTVNNKELSVINDNRLY
jgi:hypothetical protein